ncbi:hypothetical protein ASC96_17715 [Rhizobium sp. Root1204]|nr:hypothetical protein ASC96_17715 [Rhizobium sp. Root1204]
MTDVDACNEIEGFHRVAGQPRIEPLAMVRLERRIGLVKTDSGDQTPTLGPEPALPVRQF